MMRLLNAQEREDDWRRLLEKAGSRFKLLEGKRPDVRTMGIVIAVWEDPVSENSADARTKEKASAAHE